MTDAQVSSRDAWLVARKQLLAKEEETARRLEELGAERRALPMVKIDKEYLFEGPDGKATLLDLFEGRGQLITYHFMFDPTWEAGCKFCSYLVDNIGHLAHLHACDTTMGIISRAPLSKIEPFKARMGWTIPWYSSFGSDFNYDFHVTLDEAVAPIEYNYRKKEDLAEHMRQGEQNGLSVFVQRDGAVYHTYSAYVDGAELLLNTDNYLDLTPQGRPRLEVMGDWLRHHDKYETRPTGK